MVMHGDDDDDADDDDDDDDDDAPAAATASSESCTNPLSPQSMDILVEQFIFWSEQQHFQLCPCWSSRRSNYFQGMQFI